VFRSVNLCGQFASRVAQQLSILWTAAIVETINDFKGFDRQADTDVSSTCFPVRKTHDRGTSNILSADRFAVMEKRPNFVGQTQISKGFEKCDPCSCSQPSRL